MKIVIVDYGMGNIKSISSTLGYLEVSDIILSSDYEILKTADKILLPGVGSFANAINRIRDTKLDIILQELCLEGTKPLLGICLGMQLLGMSSPEDGENEGLRFVEGDVTKFETTNLKVPHVGFNQVVVNPESRLYHNLPMVNDFYFTHSYKMNSNASILQSMCNYGDDFIASFEVGNIAGTQFHPELSQKNGVQLLKNFIDFF